MDTRTASRFIWHDLDSPDPDRVLPFYSDVLGWTPEAYVGGPMPYWMWVRDGVPVGGVGKLTDDARAYGARPGWNGYVESADVDADVERVMALGGRVRIAPATLDGVGRMAVVDDPQGAWFTLFAPDSSMGPPASDSPIGRFSWRDLSTPDPDGAWAFYRELLGWTAGPSIPIGDEGSYQVVSADGLDLGGITAYGSSAAASPSWLYYVRVEGIEEVAGRVRAGGGETGVIVDIPGGRAVHCRDPEGARFGLNELATGGSES
jgi:predicted enzyme related to lactoylglutathione lyase